ncbi:MAG: hypothetical protein HY653_01025 [Acidobacteria bacterium]|nr:hypothetical protein [Acidobacteriota bacterium]
MAIATNKTILNSAPVSEGQWELVQALAVPFTVSVSGFASGDVAQVWVSNLSSQPPLAPPAVGDGTFKLGDDITADTAVVVGETWRWLRVRKSAAGGSPATTKAELQAVMYAAL